MPSYAQMTLRGELCRGPCKNVVVLCWAHHCLTITVSDVLTNEYMVVTILNVAMDTYVYTVQCAKGTQ